MRFTLARRAAALAVLAGLLPARALHAQEPVAGDARPRLGVVQFENHSPLDPAVFDPLALSIPDRLILEIRQNDSLRVFERQRLQRLVDELKLVKDGIVDPVGAARAGRMLGASHIVRGSFTADPKGRRLEIVGLIEDPELGEVIGSAKVGGKPDDILRLISDLGRQLATKVRRTTRADTPLPRGRSGDFQAALLEGRAIIEEDRGNAQQAAALRAELQAKFPDYVADRTRLASAGRGGR